MITKVNHWVITFKFNLRGKKVASGIREQKKGERSERKNPLFSAYNSTTHWMDGNVVINVYEHTNLIIQVLATELLPL